LNQIYYSDCLQSLIEQFELCMDEGLGLDLKKDGKTMGVELDLEGLMRMDTATLVKTLKEGVSGGILSPNEARKKLDLPKAKGGDTPYLQQQNYSLAALDERDQNDPFAKPAPAPAAPPPEDGSADPADGEGETPEEDAADNSEPDTTAEEEAKAFVEDFLAHLTRGFSEELAA
jgi:hypothetical protein